MWFSNDTTAAVTIATCTLIEAFAVTGRALVVPMQNPKRAHSTAGKMTPVCRVYLLHMLPRRHTATDDT